MNDDRVRRTRDDIDRLAKLGLDWVDFATRVTPVLARSIDFDRCCWHTVDPGTMLFTGSLNRGIGCSGSWLADHEYVREDVNKWWFLAQSGLHAGATSLATQGDLSRSPRHLSVESFGIGDELRGSFVADGNYWGAAGLLRDEDRPWFTEADVRFLAAMSEVVAHGLRAALLHTVVDEVINATDGPGVVVFDQHGRPEFISPSAEHWISHLIQDPPPASPAVSVMVQSVAARTRALGRDTDPLQSTARSRVRTRGGVWLTMYGTPLSGAPQSGAQLLGEDEPGRIAVIIQPAAPTEVAPLVALAYGLTDREAQVVRRCMQGRSTKQMASDLCVSPYTVQDHLKSIFDKTGVRTRNELVGQVFLEHYCPRWDDVDELPSGWSAKVMDGITPV